jgi:hypothetical protein
MEDQSGLGRKWVTCAKGLNGWLDMTPRALLTTNLGLHMSTYYAAAGTLVGDDASNSRTSTTSWNFTCIEGSDSSTDACRRSCEDDSRESAWPCPAGCSGREVLRPVMSRPTFFTPSATPAPRCCQWLYKGTGTICRDYRSTPSRIFLVSPY